LASLAKPEIGEHELGHGDIPILPLLPRKLTLLLFYIKLYIGTEYCPHLSQCPCLARPIRRHVCCGTTIKVAPYRDCRSTLSNADEPVPANLLLIATTIRDAWRPGSHAAPLCQRWSPPPGARVG
jgi:hypothetical protein